MSDPLPLLQEFYQDKLTTLVRHIAGARHIGQYDANNTYQYVINREETQLQWIGQAIVALGGTVTQQSAEPDRGAAKDKSVAARIMSEDAGDAQAFVDRWKPKVEAMTNVRHRNMLLVVLNECLEQKRFFEQGAAGNENLLGVRTPAAGARVGSVLPTRWIE